MKNIWTKSVAWWTARKLRTKIILIAGILLVVGIVVRSGKVDTTIVTESVKRQDISRTVATSGIVVSSTDLSLSFETSKIVDSVKVKVGDIVKKGDVIATQKSGSERATYQSARGTFLAAQARYDKVLQGSSNEEVTLAKIQLENAKRKLYSSDLIADPQDTITTSPAPTITGTYIGKTEGEYRISFTNYAKTDIRYSGLEKGTTDVDTLPQSLGALGLRISFPEFSYDPDDSWKILIPNKSGINYTANKALVDEKEAALALTRATARQPEIDGALADIVSAQAQVDAANASLEKTILRAPADGTITRVDVRVGEVPDAMKPVFVLQDVSNLYLEANVNETSVGLLAVGQPVSITFDSFGKNKYYQGVLASIDPSATIVDSIVNYKIRVFLEGVRDEQVRPGMTANMIIEAAHVSQALTIPGRAIIRNENGTYSTEVIIDARDKKTELRTIEIGLRGDGDLVEVTNGLTESQSVAWKVK